MARGCGSTSPNSDGATAGSGGGGGVSDGGGERGGGSGNGGSAGGTGGSVGSAGRGGGSGGDGCGPGFPVGSTRPAGDGCNFCNCIAPASWVCSTAACPIGGSGGGAAADGGAGGSGGRGGGGASAGRGGAGGGGGECPVAGSTSIYPTGTCTGGMGCMGPGVTCDCVSSQWRQCRLTSCPIGVTGHPYACMTDVQRPPGCACMNVMSPTQTVPYCTCNQS